MRLFGELRKNLNVSEINWNLFLRMPERDVQITVYVYLILSKCRELEGQTIFFPLFFLSSFLFFCEKGMHSGTLASP